MTLTDGRTGGKVPLKAILQQFIAHVDSMTDEQYDREFQNLKLLSEGLKSLEEYSCSEGEKDHNRRKNRYKDILPFDYSRVMLRPILGIPGSDYVNANYIRGASGSVAYIASQGPLPNTLADFWRMVVECEVRVIVMACSERESGKHKCECYWPTSIDEDRSLGNVRVSLVKTRQVCSDFTLRTLRINYTKEEGGPEETRMVCQFHYFAWPDHGVPLEVRPLIDMVLLLRDCQSSETCPVLVHCSAGCGRTGTICAIDFVWGLLRTGRLRENFNLFDVITEMRKQRVAMVQTREQYALVHRAVKELFGEQLRMIEAHPYENIDLNGEPLLDAEVKKDVRNLCQMFEKLESKAGPVATKLTRSSSAAGLRREVDEDEDEDEKDERRESKFLKLRTAPTPPMRRKKALHTERALKRRSSDVCLAQKPTPPAASKQPSDILDEARALLERTRADAIVRSCEQYLKDQKNVTRILVTPEVKKPEVAVTARFPVSEGLKPVAPPRVKRTNSVSISVGQYVNVAPPVGVRRNSASSPRRVEAAAVASRVTSPPSSNAVLGRFHSFRVKLPSEAPTEPRQQTPLRSNLTRNRTLIGIGSLRSAQQARSNQQLQQSQPRQSHSPEQRTGRPALVLHARSRQQYV